jgi:hypothetical protein
MADYDLQIDDVLSGNVNTDSKVEFVGLDNIKVDTTLGGRVDSAVTLHSDSTVSSDSKVATTSSLDVAPLTTSSSVDLAPVAVDTCVRVELGSLPATEISTPWEQRLALRVLGVELFSWVLCGESTTTVRPMRRTPVVMGTVEQGHPADCGCGCRARDDDGHDSGLQVRWG